MGPRLSKQGPELSRAEHPRATRLLYRRRDTATSDMECRVSQCRPRIRRHMHFPPRGGLALGMQTEDPRCALAPPPARQGASGGLSCPFAGYFKPAFPFPFHLDSPVRATPIAQPGLAVQLKQIVNSKEDHRHKKTNSGGS